MKTKILLQGISGRMGHVLQDLIAQRNDCEVVAGVTLQDDYSCNVPVFHSISECSVAADVLIDFSNPATLADTITYCTKNKLPCVICTTGLSEEQNAALTALSKNVPVFKSANMSMGINLLIELAKKANQVLGLQYDIEIIEKHHHNKLDAPSGTALMIGDAIKDASAIPYHYVYDRHEQRQKRDAHEIGMHAVRGGSIVGEHEVLFCGQDEVLTLSHSAESRAVFAQGAINAALFIADKQPGYYTMKEMLGL